MQHIVNGTKLNVLEQGEGNPALVFLHYFGGSANFWTEVIAQLRHECHCIALDLPGFGESEPIAGNTVKDMATCVLALVEQLQLKQYILVGHSMGGKVALAIAATQIAQLKSLVLLAPSPPTPEPMEDAERSHLLQTGGDRAAAEKTVRKITAHSLPDRLFNRVIQDNIHSSPAAWRAWLECGSREDISAQMSRIAVPVLIVAGAEDPVMSKDMLQQEVVDRLAIARLVVVSQVGHLLPIENPQAVSELIQLTI
ncbi:alpha/beta hydrolase (plasmid) [Phormidium sp. CLA17]|uniref:alpha/beta fold hydrolase n=1 Tax=Leptolyngbya sp. Cla-17 TaxID=2803751 RepID=UPI001492A1C5|nr:alpha/beta hydrolase [Leptolyngbya sp. Cla-17]MBM0745367.1 alpha/beta hydrolase [Leptolyngbya sp. Cla-17]